MRGQACDIAILFDTCGESDLVGSERRKDDAGEIDGERLLEAVEQVCRISRRQFLGSGKNSRALVAKETAIIVGRRMGASVKMLGAILELGPSNVSRRHAAAMQKLRDNGQLADIVAEATKAYERAISRIAISHA